MQTTFFHTISRCITIEKVTKCNECQYAANQTGKGTAGKTQQKMH